MYRIVILVAGLALVTPGSSLAGDDRASETMIARGLELRRQGKPDQALEMFQRAHALGASPRTLGQMGLVEGTLEHWTESEEHLSGALAAPNDPWVRKNHTDLQSALDTVKGHIGQLIFSGTPGATIAVAGKLVGTLPGVPPIRVGAGTVLVTASRSGSKQLVQSVSVQAGMQTEITVKLQPVDVRPHAPVATERAAVPMITELRTRHSWKTWTGGGLLAVGAAAMTWGIVWVAADGRGAGGTCTASSDVDCMPVYDTRTPGWMLTAAGGASAVLGGYLLYSAQKNGTDVTVGMGPRSLTLAGRF